MGRKHASASEKAAAIQAYRKSGKSLSQFCNGRGISYQTFRNWLNRSESLKSEPPTVIAFTPSPISQQSNEYRISFLDGTVLSIPGAISLQSILSVLRGKE